MPDQVSRHVSKHDAVARLRDAEARLEGVRARLDQSERLATLGTFAAAIVHEMNNLLTPALHYLSLARRQPEDDDLARRAIDTAAEAIESASRAASSILDLASGREAAADGQTSADAPEHPGSRGSADVNAAVNAALRCLPRSPERHRITLDVRVPSGLMAAASQVDLQQVLLNLLLNAVVVLRGAEEPRRLEIDAEEVEGGWVVLKVSDTGPGIAPEVRDRLFEPFAGCDEGPGHGLGLWLCKLLIERAGGTVHLEDRAGGGVLFVIRLKQARSNQIAA